MSIENFSLDRTMHVSRTAGPVATGILLENASVTSRTKTSPDSVYWDAGDSTDFDLGGGYVLTVTPIFFAASSGSVTHTYTFDVLANFQLSLVPEPSTYLAGVGALGMLGMFGWRNRK